MGVGVMRTRKALQPLPPFLTLPHKGGGNKLSRLHRLHPSRHAALVPPCPASVGIDIGGHDIGRRHRRGLAGLGGIIDHLAYLGFDAGDGLFADAELQQALLIDLDRVALLPAIELALRPVRWFPSIARSRLLNVRTAYEIATLGSL